MGYPRRHDPKSIVSAPRRLRGGPVFNPRTLSQLMADVDRVWLAPHPPSRDASLLVAAAGLEPEEAARFLLARVPHQNEGVGLAEGLDAIGIALGTLTTNRGARRGVRGLWRSTLPIVLVSTQPRRKSSMPREIAEQVGYLLYGEQQSASGVLQAQIFARSFQSTFSCLWPRRGETKTPSIKTSRRHLALANEDHDRFF